MTRTASRIAFLALAGWLLLGPGTSTAHAQRRPVTVGQQSALNIYRSTVNPRYYVTPWMTLNQYAYNTAVLGRAYSNVPPYVLGYNPYPQVINYGPVYRYPTYYPTYYPYSVYTPYLGYNPYALYGTGLTTNPYLP
jgi:hypothetical protein